MPTKQPIHATLDYQEAAPKLMDGCCAWPGCNQNINRYAPYCMTHSRYVTYASKGFPPKTRAYLRKMIKRRPLGPVIAINMIRLIEQARGLDYLSSRIGGLGV